MNSNFSMSALQLARVFAQDVQEKHHVKPFVLNSRQGFAQTGHDVKALVMYEGLGDGMIEMTLTGKYMTGRFFLEPINGYQIGVYERYPRRRFR